MQQILLLFFIGCFGACSGAEEPTKENSDNNGSSATRGEEQMAGHLFLQNDTAYAITTAYLNEIDPYELQIVRSHVAPGERQDVGQGLLPAGVTFELDIVVMVPVNIGFRVRRKAQIYINGEQLVQVYAVDSNDPFSIKVDF